jgi:hypothetical protein
MLAAMAPFALDVLPPPSPVNADSPIDEIIAHTIDAEKAVDLLGGALSAGAAPVEGVESSTTVIKGVDDNAHQNLHGRRCPYDRGYRRWQRAVHGPGPWHTLHRIG